MLVSRSVLASARPDAFLWVMCFCGAQVVTTVQSADNVNDTTVLAVNAASTALCLSPLPWEGPVGCVRVRTIPSLVGPPSTALRCSHTPFAYTFHLTHSTLCPRFPLQVGLVDGKLVVNPTEEEMGRSKLDLLYAGNERRTLMIEAGGEQVGSSVHTRPRGGGAKARSKGWVLVEAEAGQAVYA
jgi:polyribonucleotide nucleotidyltransferase